MIISNLLTLRLNQYKINLKYFMSPVSVYVENCIRQELQKNFNPTVLEVINTCAEHDEPVDEENYFKVVVVSDKFEGKSEFTVIYNDVYSCTTKEVG